jgi:hypothetical protein
VTHEHNELEWALSQGGNWTCVRAFRTVVLYPDARGGLSL